MMLRGHAATCVLVIGLGLGLPARAQRIGPVDCPAVVDGAGERVGPIVGLGVPNSSDTLFFTDEDDSVVITAISVDGEVFLLAVMRDQLVGTMDRSKPLIFATPDCTGVPLVRYGQYFEQSYNWQGSGPAPVTLVLGPQMTLWVLDVSAPTETITAGSQLFPTYGDPRLMTCTPWIPPLPLTGQRLRFVADLARAFSPPFVIEDGRCPNPGGGRR